MFNKDFFKKYQSKLLWFLNSPIIKVWFRWCLRIRKYDCSLSEKITEITPNSFSCRDRYYNKNGKWFLEKTRDFRTHNKYAKRLYLAFKPLWWGMHIWDLFADRLTPSLSFGFSTLTAYPDPGPTESTSVDGRAYTTGQATWALAHDAATGDGAGDNEGGTGISMVESTHQGGLYEIIRAFLLFDTSAINDAETITAATLSVWGSFKTNTDNDGNDYVNVYTTTPASNTAITTADFDQIGTTEQATSIDYGSITADDTIYTNFTLNATGRGNISKTGITKFGMREGHDVLNDPIAVATRNDLDIRTAESTGTTNDPKLVVTSSLAVKFKSSLSMLKVG